LFRLASKTPKYYHPLQDAPGFAKDRITSNRSIFVANETINSENFSDAMMGDFESGAGPENFYFGTNHSVSSAMANSEIVHNAIIDFQNINSDVNSDDDGIRPLNWKHYSQSKIFAGLAALGSLSEGGENNAATVENFIGGAAVKITPLCKATEAGYIIVRVSIMNVTSVGSGNVSKKEKSNPRSLSETKPEPYSNISQTIEFDAKVKLY
jgi:hypothetical protein